jgi:hypothetical protein
MALISALVKKQVAMRANYLCEYCCASAIYSAHPFNLDHIIPISQNGSNDLSNLAHACGGCNGSKFDKTHGIDPTTKEFVSLFNPRTMIWSEHFIWSENFLEMVGISSIGRATIFTLKTNRDGVKNLRKLLMYENLHPPTQ